MAKNKINVIIAIVVIIIILVLAVIIFTPKETNAIKIGIISPLTGDAASWGSETKKGIENSL